MTTLLKQPSESRLYNIDFASLLATGETIASVTSVTPDSVDLTVGSGTISGSKVQFQVSDGVAGAFYTITAKILTSASNSLEGEGRLHVIDVAEDAARESFELLCPSDSNPTLTEEEVLNILAKAKRASTWTANTVYTYGQTIMPTTRNGRRYRLVSFDGTGVSSGTTEPSWPGPTINSDWPIDWSVYQSETIGWWRQAIVTDGNLIWQEDGADYDSLWDINHAAQLGWLAKASKAVCKAVDVTTNKNAMALSQIYDHCVAQANRFAPIRVL